ncbi:DNA translocase FtsK [Candidatus Dependentiae bacterium]|nr:DNA translocase FtsK [Candidatus Dependentiae bacterium]MBU4387109.1 DNA translocase FtsK [Candidatus Dependentiae bacterium]MCG2756511.1 DNA translocase FtsK [Candidatus Dependentiae bacterium]
MFGFGKNSPKIKLYKPGLNWGKYKYEALAFSVFCFSVITFLSIFSFNSNDQSWFYVSIENQEIKNILSSFGANYSALLFYLFGSAAYIFAFGLSFYSYLIFKYKKISKTIYRAVAFFLFNISISSILYSFNFDFTNSYPGGLFGISIFKLMALYMGFFGATAFNFFLLILFFIPVANISFKYLFKLFFNLIINIVGFVVAKVVGTIKFIFLYIYSVVLSSLNFVWQITKDYFCTVFRKDYSDISEDFFIEQPVFVENNINKENFDPAQMNEQEACLSPMVQDQDSKDIKIQVDKLINYKLPDTNIFQSVSNSDEKLKKQLEQEGVVKAQLLEEKLKYFGIKGTVTAIHPGPVITLFEYKPEIDSKISKIISLEDDLALALMALSIRIVAPIPGKSVVGFEISNKTRQNVLLAELLNSKEFKNFSGKLPIVFGVDIVGNSVIQDLSGMPHLLVAGSTGSGKSVGLNTMLVSLLCQFKPDQLKLILIDPKRLEFAPYKDIPHLLFPIITNPRQASPVLKWLVQEMEMRYDKMSHFGVRNIFEYQDLAKNDNSIEQMPFIVLMIDELADLMMVAGKDIEIHIARIAQMARAAGIHMVIATQRPSVDVITGLIKVNFPSRIAFRVSSKIDSRTIVDCSGAEKLLGRGDMLYMNSASSDLQRIHGAYVGVKEIEKLTAHLRAQAEPEYLDLNETLREMSKSEVENIEDELYPDVLEFIKKIEEISISGLQRRYRIGFNRSARIIEKLEFDGLLAPAQGSKPRKILKDNL